jgi:hypothetical protein
VKNKPIKGSHQIRTISSDFLDYQKLMKLIESNDNNNVRINSNVAGYMEFDPKSAAISHHNKMKCSALKRSSKRSNWFNL